MHLKYQRNIQLLLRVTGAKVFLFILPVLLLSITSCNKSSVVGLDVQPDEDLLNVIFSDSSSLMTYIRSEDSVRSDETSTNLLGSYNDPIFGKTSTSVFTQFNTNTVTFGNASELLIDSVILSIAYTGDYYGALDAQTLKVYELTQAFFRDSLYYSKRMLSYNISELASYNFIPKPTDSVLVGLVKQKPQIRIRLTDAFGQGFLNQSGFADNAAFITYFKGLFITSANTQAPGQGALMSMSLTDAQTGITLYYRNKFGSKGKQYSFTFNINSSASARFGHFDHDDALTPVALQLNDSTLGQNLVYIQPLGGPRTHLRFPQLKNFIASGPIAINKAELVLKVDPSTIGIYSVPAALALVTIDAQGKTGYLPDQFEGDTYFAGTYNATNKEYKFNIARYIQGVLTGKQTDQGLYISTAKLGTEASATSAKRVVLGGGSNTSYKMKLRITYTKLH